MGKIYCLMGKSAAGKDSIYRLLLSRKPSLSSYIMYTTRPPREGEEEGKAYHFVDEAFLERRKAEGRLIEERVYQTVYGPWRYATVDDGQIRPEGDYLMPATLESYLSLRRYFGAERVLPLYIEADDGERLIRSIRREQQEKHPKYEELCRRFLADEKDFSEEKLEAAGIHKRYRNDELEVCAGEILADMD